VTEPSSLDARYGRTPANARRVRATAILAAGAFAVVFTAWLVWGGLLGAPARLEATDVGHTVADDATVAVRWQLTVDPGTPVRCAVQALNANYGVVGWKVVDVPASATRTRTLSDTVRTVAPAVTGLIYRCWLT